MLKSLRIKNFKAIRDSKAIRLTPLTVFIGNNGSGKSSIIKALETYKTIICPKVPKKTTIGTIVIDEKFK